MPDFWFTFALDVKKLSIASPLPPSFWSSSCSICAVEAVVCEDCPKSCIGETEM